MPIWLASGDAIGWWAARVKGRGNPGSHRLLNSDWVRTGWRRDLRGRICGTCEREVWGGGGHTCPAPVTRGWICKGSARLSHRWHLSQLRRQLRQTNRYFGHQFILFRKLNFARKITNFYFRFHLMVYFILTIHISNRDILLKEWEYNYNKIFTRNPNGCKGNYYKIIKQMLA